MKLTLGTDSNERKDIPITSGVLKYAPAALAGVARVSKAGNDKHNPGEPLHHARGKSTDHSDCIARHLFDVNDILAHIERSPHLEGEPESQTIDAMLNEVSQLAWRALMWSQELHEEFGGAPLAPGARLQGTATPGCEQFANAPSVWTKVAYGGGGGVGGGGVGGGGFISGTGGCGVGGVISCTCGCGVIGGTLSETATRTDKWDADAKKRQESY